MDGSSEEFKALISDEELKGIFDELEHWGNCVGLYMHGSTIFLNHQPNDLDLIAIVDGAKRLIDPNTKESQFILGRCEVSVYTREFFLDRLEAMDMTMLTCLSTPARFIIKGLEDDRVRNFQLKLDVLEEQTASYADYTWLKSHRLLDRTKVLYKACKNTYFSFRLLDFGCQLVETGRIPDLAAANGIYDCAKQIWELLQIQPGDWDVVEAVFGHHFEMMRKKFQLSMEAAKLGRVELPQEPQPEDTEPEESCSLCGCQMDGSQKFQVDQPLSAEHLNGYWVKLANCSHRFHLTCIAEFIRNSSRSRRGGAWCPTCNAKVRVKVTTWRAYAFWGPKGPGAAGYAPAVQEVQPGVSDSSPTSR